MRTCFIWRRCSSGVSTVARSGTCAMIRRARGLRCLAAPLSAAHKGSYGLGRACLGAMKGSQPRSTMVGQIGDRGRPGFSMCAEGRGLVMSSQSFCRSREQPTAVGSTHAYVCRQPSPARLSSGQLCTDTVYDVDGTTFQDGCFSQDVAQCWPPAWSRRIQSDGREGRSSSSRADGRWGREGGQLGGIPRQL